MARRNEWRNTGRVARFFLFDARASVGMVIFMAHWSLVTFEIAVVVFVLFGVLERWGFSVAVAWRWLRSRLAGAIRPSSPWWHRPWGDA